MASPDPKYLKNSKQKKLYLQNLEKRFRIAIREEDEKYPDAKVSPIDIVKMVFKLLTERV